MYCVFYVNRVISSILGQPSQLSVAKYNRRQPSLTERTKCTQPTEPPKRPHFSTHLYLSLYTPLDGLATLGVGVCLRRVKNFLGKKKPPVRGHSSGGTNRFCLKFLRNQGLHFEKQLFNCKAYYTLSLFPVNFFCVNIR